MWLFLLLSIPCSFLLINSYFPRRKWNPVYTVSTILKSLIMAILALVLFWASRFRLDFSIYMPRLYYYSFVYHGGISLLGAILIFCLWELIPAKLKYNRYQRLREYLLLWGTYFFILSVKDVMSLQGAEGVVYLFVTPLIRISLTILFAIMSDRLLQVKVKGRILLILLMSALAFLLPLLYMQAYLNQFIILVVVTVLFTGFSATLMLLEFKGKIPYGSIKRN